MRQYLKCFALTGLMALGGVAQTLANDKVLRISTLESSRLGELCMLTITAAWNRAGYQVEPVFLPAKRSLLQAAAGTFDGEACRVYSVGEKFKTLRRVDASHISMDNYAWFAAGRASEIDPNNLRNYHIGILAGIVRLTNHTETWNRSIAATAPQLFKMVESHRIHAAILSEITGTITINQNFKPQDFLRSAEPLISDPLYHYLFERNEALIPLITSVIGEMQQDGSLKKVKDDYLAGQAYDRKESKS